MKGTARAFRWAFAMTTTLAMAACGDRELTNPVEPAPGARATLSTTSPRSPGVVGMLRRTEKLPRSISATGVIGPKGGHLQIGRAGVRVTFAPGAVAVPTRITVTAVGGRVVAYRFAPHGLVFDAPVTIRQDLRKTVAWRNPELTALLGGSYFDRLMVDRTATYARSEERRPARARDKGRFLEFSIEHFSGYMVSTGLVSVRVEVDVDAGIEISGDIY